jgi:uncharacterized protein (TIGR02996 family)
MKEEAFLGAVRANQGDRTTRLVYADWLEEHGDLRSELIRIEEEMRLLPVFCDRFWQLKPRRNELRALSPTNWLQNMRYGTDTQPVFRHGFPDGWRERWRVIRELVDQWRGFNLGDVNGQQSKIRETVSRLGRQLPESVREWVAFAHDVGGKPFADDDERFWVFEHDPSHDPYEMIELEGHSAISLLLQDQNDLHWAVRHQDLSLPDPPVYGFANVMGYEFPTAPSIDNPLAKSVTDFVVEYTLGCTAGHGSFYRDVTDSATLAQQLRNAFPVFCNLEHTRLFEAENVLITMREWPALHVRVFKPLAREAIPEFLWSLAKNATVRGNDFFLPEGQ